MFYDYCEWKSDDFKMIMCISKKCCSSVVRLSLATKTKKFRTKERQHKCQNEAKKKLQSQSNRESLFTHALSFLLHLLLPWAAFFALQKALSPTKHNTRELFGRWFHDSSYLFTFKDTLFSFHFPFLSNVHIILYAAAAIIITITLIEMFILNGRTEQTKKERRVPSSTFCATHARDV